jgi:hypothetical protein
MKLVTITAAAAAFSMNAFAQSSCPSPEALEGPASAFDSLFDAKSEVAPEKGEFETTAQFEARKQASQPPGATLLALETDPEWFSYDADRELFATRSFYFQPSYLSFIYDVRNTPWENVYGGSRSYAPVSLSAYEQVTSESEYEAQNGYGAQFMVTAKTVTEAVVFDRPGRQAMNAMYDTLFTENMGKTERPGVELLVPVPLADAPRVKSELQAVAWIVPKEPFFDQRQDYSGATTSTPIARTTDYRIIHADIQCFGIRDAAGNVLAHWSTR